MDGHIDLDDHHQQQQQQQRAAPDFGRVLTDIDIAKANLLTMLNQVRKVILYRCPFSSRIASRVLFLASRLPLLLRTSRPKSTGGSYRSDMIQYIA